MGSARASPVQFQSLQQPQFVPLEPDAARTVGQNGNGIATVGGRLQRGLQKDVFGRHLFDARRGRAHHAMRVERNHAPTARY